MSEVEEKDLGEDYAKSWLAHPHTRRVRTQLESERRTAIASLINAASTSSDPDVRAAVTRYRGADAMVQKLGGKAFSEEVKRG